MSENGFIIQKSPILYLTIQAMRLAEPFPSCRISKTITGTGGSTTHDPTRGKLNQLSVHAQFQFALKVAGNRLQ